MNIKENQVLFQELFSKFEIGKEMPEIEASESDIAATINDYFFCFIDLRLLQRVIFLT